MEHQESSTTVKILISNQKKNITGQINIAHDIYHPNQHRCCVGKNSWTAFTVCEWVLPSLKELECHVNRCNNTECSCSEAWFKFSMCK